MNSRRTPFTASGESEILDLEGDMYLGGLPENRAGLILPTELWTAMLNYGYVGCIRDLFIDGRSKNIRQLAEMQNAAGVKSSCSRMSAKQCDSYPCKNNAMCKDGWNRFICDCTGTGYWGRTCERGKSALVGGTLGLRGCSCCSCVPGWTTGAFFATTGATFGPTCACFLLEKSFLGFISFQIIPFLALDTWICLTRAELQKGNITMIMILF